MAEGPPGTARLNRRPVTDRYRLVKWLYASTPKSLINACDTLSRVLRISSTPISVRELILRDAIAHFLIEREGEESHVYVADGRQLQAYAIGSSALLRYAHRVLEDLRLFCTQRMLFARGAMILPMQENRDQFVVRARDYGLE